MHQSISENLQTIKSLFKQYGVVEASLFGSAVGSNFKPDSDFDFLIKFDASLDVETYANNYFNLMYALQDLLKHEVDLVAQETVSNPYFAKTINANKIALL